MPLCFEWLPFICPARRPKGTAPQKRACAAQAQDPRSSPENECFHTSIPSAQACIFPQALGQHLRQLGSACVKRLTHGGYNKLLRKTRREPVHRNYAPRDSADRTLALDNRVCHRAFSADADDLSVYIQAVAAMDIVFDIRLVEKCYVNRTALINDAELYKLKSPAYAHKAGILRSEGVYANSFPVAGQRNRLKAAAILIFPRKIRNKVTDVKDAELIEKQRLFSPMPLQYRISVSR